MGISGTYDVLAISFLIPRKDVFPLLPPNLRSEQNLLSVPQEVLDLLSKSEEISKPMHPLLLQMGYQINTGPGPDWLPKMSFNEMKLEVPYIRHPSGKSDEAMNLKQYMIFSNTIIKLGAQGTGLRSTTAHFSPKNTPFDRPADAAQIEFAALPYLNATATRSSRDGAESLKIMKSMQESWWFGQGTGNVVQKFDFDWESAPIKPTAYDVVMDLDLSEFAENDLKNNLSTVKVEGLGWRTKVKVASKSRNVDE